MTKRKRNVKLNRRDRAKLLPTEPARKPPRSDRHQLIALVMSSLICGLLMVINGDRVTHAGNDLAIGENRHGWPLVYLTRNLIEVPALYLPSRTYSWPYPPARNETREVSWVNLGVDAAVILLITVVSYFVISQLIWRYDRWRYSGSSES